MDIHQRLRLHQKYTIIERIKNIILAELDYRDHLDFELSADRYTFYEKTHRYKKHLKNLNDKKQKLLNKAQFQREINEAEEDYEKKALAFAEANYIITRELYDQKDNFQEMQSKIAQSLNNLLKQFETEIEDLKIIVEEIGNTITYCPDLEEFSNQNEMIIDNYNEIIKWLKTLQSNDWRHYNHEMRVAGILEKHNMITTRSGRILTKSGDKLSFEEANEKGCFDSISICTTCLAPFVKAVSHYNLAILKNASFTTAKLDESSDIFNIDSTSFLMKVRTPLMLALTEMLDLQPLDPIYYLTQWLIKYHYNPELDKDAIDYLDQLDQNMLDRTLQTWKKTAMFDAQQIVTDIIERVMRIIDEKEQSQKKVAVNIQVEPDRELDIWEQATNEEQTLYRFPYFISNRNLKKFKCVILQTRRASSSTKRK